MATFADMTIQDGSAVGKVFKARVNSNLITTYELPHASGHAVASTRIKVRYTPAPRPDEKSKTDISVRIPIVDAPAASGGYTPAPREIAYHEAKMIFFTSGRGTFAEASDLLAFAKNLLSQAQISESVTQNSPIRG
jgi:hypothetical protein